MPRRPRKELGGYVLHVVNRGSRRGELFASHRDYAAFDAVLREALARSSVDLYEYCAMPNHFHFVLWPPVESDLRNFMHWFTTTHAVRWRRASGTVGQGAVYQSRYKAIPVQTEEYFTTLCRYVARNPVRAHLISRPEDWRWSSISRFLPGGCDLPLARWPVPRPEKWVPFVNEPDGEEVLRAIRESVNRGSPLGNQSWREQTAKLLGLERTLRGPGRPKATKVADRKN